MVMDAVAHRLTGSVEQCDRDGALAAAGRVDPGMLASLLQNAYFALPPPKSTGRERFGAATWMLPLRKDRRADCLAPI